MLVFLSQIVAIRVPRNLGRKVFDAYDVLLKSQFAHEFIPVMFCDSVANSVEQVVGIVLNDFLVELTVFGLRIVLVVCPAV